MYVGVFLERMSCHLFDYIKVIRQVFPIGEITPTNENLNTEVNTELLTVQRELE